MGPAPILIQRGILRKLICLPYGIVEAGIQWLCAVEQWFTKSLKLRHAPEVDQPCYKRREDSSVSMFVTKVVDDFIIAGSRNMIQTFLHQLNYRFKLGHVKQNKKVQIFRVLNTKG